MTKLGLDDLDIDQIDCITEKFYARVIKTDTCWNWRLACNTHGGHGVWCVPFLNRQYRTNRIAYFLHHRADPGELIIRHICDNPKCVRVDHLLSGTHADNVKDRTERGRSACGINNGRTKLKPNDIPKIRQLITDGISDTLIGKQFGVNHKAIGNIRNGKTWILPK